MEACGGKIVGTGIGGEIPQETRAISYSPELFKKKTGIDMDASTQREILKSLGFEIKEKGNVWTIIPTPARVDIEIPENIVSELIRIYGYENIAKIAKHQASDSAPHKDFYIGIKKELAARGLNEAKSYGFGDSKIEELLSDKLVIKIANPIISNMDTARNGLLGTMLGFVSENEKRGYPDLDMFELSTVFDGDMPGQQHTQICIVRTGNTSPKHWMHRNRVKDVYDVKADIIALMHGQKFTVSDENAPRWAHPFRYGAIYQGKKKIAEFGELHPSVARSLKIKTPVMIAIIDDVENVPLAKKCKEPVISDFQPITRDFAFIVDADASAEKLTSSAVSADPRIKEAIVFDSFDMGDGKKSVAFTITIIPTENMSDSDLLKIQDTVIENVEKKCNAKIRDK